MRFARSSVTKSAGAGGLESWDGAGLSVEPEVVVELGVGMGG